MTGTVIYDSFVRRTHLEQMIHLLGHLHVKPRISKSKDNVLQTALPLACFLLICDIGLRMGARTDVSTSLKTL